MPAFTISGQLPSTHRYSHCLSGDNQSETKVLGVPLESNFKIECLFRTKTLPERSQARPEETSKPSVEAKIFFVPSVLNSRIKWLPPPAPITPVIKRLPAPSTANSRGSSRPEAKPLFVPSGLNLRIHRPILASRTAQSTTKRLPAPSKARSIGLPRPETNVLFTPSGVNLKMESSWDTKRLPERSKAMPTELMPLANVLFFASGVSL